MATEIAAGAALGRLLQPLVKDLYEGAKRAGATGLQKWDQRGFLAKLGKRIGALENVRTLWKPDATISLREFFHPPKLHIGNKAVLVTRLSDLPTNATIIEGIVGQGKSVLLRSLAVEDIRSNEAKRLPVFIELKDLGAKLDLVQAIHKTLETYDIQVDADSLEYLYRNGKIALLLDGFDELDETMVKLTFLEIEHLAVRYPDLQIVVTSRPNHEIQKSARFEIHRIAQLTAPEYAAFLGKLKVSPEKSLSLRQAIKNSPGRIGDVITTPLMLTLVVIVYEAEAQIPETLPEFYERLFQVVFTRHDRLKAAFSRKHHSGLSEHRLQSLFEAFCFMTLQLGYSRSLTQAQFQKAFDLALDYSDDCTCDVAKFRLDITRVACLMLEDGMDSITFLHKSIQEYYAATFVKRLGEENARRFYSAAINNNTSWIQTLIFLNSIDPYRYSAHYLLPSLAVEEENVCAPARGAANDDRALIELTMSLYPEIGVYFKYDEENKELVRARAYGSIKDRPVESLGNLGRLLLDAMMETVPLTMSALELRQKFLARPEDGGEGEYGVHVPASRLLNEYSVSHIRQAYEIYIRRLSEKSDFARRTIAKEERMTLIFDKKSR